MATYIMSDIHGCYQKYIKMLELIDFKNNDTLYVLGDVVDRGSDPIRVLLDMMQRTNVIPLWGNHEIMCRNLLEQFKNCESSSEVKAHLEASHELALKVWGMNGGKTTLIGFLRLSKPLRNQLLYYIDTFKFYEELTVNQQDFLLVHAGLGHFRKDKPLTAYTIEDMVSQRADYNRVYFEDKILITGHTPTSLFSEKDKIYKKNNHIAIDCGAVFTGTLAAIRLDDMSEFYTF